MDAADEVGYIPPPEFEEIAEESLIDIDLGDSKELWLIQWPNKQPQDFDGAELSLNLDQDGQLGSFEGLSGKAYDVVSFASQEPDATVFGFSGSESKIVGKIARRVSLVHYPDPNELVKSDNLKMYQRSGGTTLTGTSRGTPRSTKTRTSGSASKHAASSHRQKSSLIGVGDSAKPSKSKHTSPKRSNTHGTVSSMNESSKKSTVTSGSLELSRESKKKMNLEKARRK